MSPYILPLLLKVIFPRYYMIFWHYVEKLVLSLICCLFEYNVFFFSFFIYIFSFPLVLLGTMMSSSVFFFVFILLGVCSAPLIYGLIFMSTGKFSITHSLNRASSHHLLSHFEAQIICMLDLLTILGMMPMLSSAFCFFFPSLLPPWCLFTSFSSPISTSKYPICW